MVGQNRQYAVGVSELITQLRFPLAFMVVMHHWLGIEDFSGLLEISANGRGLAQWGVGALYRVCVQAVPVFFMISGYLFFINLSGGDKRFSLQFYASKLVRRVRTLLVPLIVWSMATVVLYGACGFIVHGCSVNIFVNTIVQYIRDDGLRLFWDSTELDGTRYPILVPLWYLRDLMIMVLASPLFYFALRPMNSPWLSAGRYLLIAAAMLFVNLYGCWPFKTGASWNAVFWFGTGCALSLNKAEASLVRVTWFGPVLLFASLVSYEILRQYSEWQCFLHILNITLVVGFVLSAWKLLECTKLRFPMDYSKATMFIYCWHEVPLVGGIFIARKIMEFTWTVGVGNSVPVLLFFIILMPLAQAVGGVYIHNLLRRVCPRIMVLLLGK